MRRLTKFLALPAEDRRTFAVSVALLCVVRLSLWIVPFRWLRAAVRRVAPPPDGTPEPTPGEAERTVQVIESRGQIRPRRHLPHAGACGRAPPPTCRTSGCDPRRRREDVERAARGARLDRGVRTRTARRS